MKKTLNVAWMSLLAVVLAMSVQAIAQSPSQDSAAAMQQQTTLAQDTSNATDAKTFTGKIVKAGDKLVLRDAASNTTYQLDDQDKAKEFVGKDVKVVGTLDMANSLIRITMITPAA